MLNSELFDYSEQELLNLRNAVKAFKEYDKKRKEYYKNIELELGQWKSYAQELEDLQKQELPKKKELKRARETINEQKLLIDHQLRIINALTNKEVLIPELVQLQFYKDKISELEKSLEEKRDKLKDSKKEIKELIEIRNQLLCKLNETN